MTEIDNRERILARAKDLFMQYGIRSVSMDDIASEIGISKKTIYQYFADKEELVSAVILFKIGESKTRCDLDRQQSINAIDEMFRAMEMAEQMFRTMNPSVIPDLRKYHPVAYTHFEKHKNDYLYNVIRTNLVKGIGEELYRPELNVEIIARLRLDSMLMPFDQSFLVRQKATLADVEQQVIEHYLFGIVTLKGYKLVLKYQQKRKKI
ncbi:TetR/AcrR family transcriptional regulator [Flavihumibacter solisilvae]|uniref:TetR/AcrR family transcriptional regulator n=1 Tax=Flavihumibacter solisilvae TaxID=1349421 RepID=UPI0006904E37|nr:TetR/AcrR family transcriptional regulator [Flavihumibacter solisilvae]